jgi:hypothetical protein
MLLRSVSRGRATQDAGDAHSSRNLGERREVERVRAEELGVAAEVRAPLRVARGREHAPRVPVRGALLHQHRVRGHGGEGVEAQVARADGVVVEEVRAERGAEDLVGALDWGPVVRRVFPVGLDVERGHVRLQPLERRLLAARELLRLLALRPQPELPVRHRRLEKVEARREPVRAVLPLQHHHRQRRERQARDDHARERVQLVLRAQGGQRIHRKVIRVQQVLKHFRRQRRVLAVLDIHLRAIFTAARGTLGLHAHICNESRSFKHYIFFSGMLERLFIVSVFTHGTFMGDNGGLDSKRDDRGNPNADGSEKRTTRGDRRTRNSDRQTAWKPFEGTTEYAELIGRNADESKIAEAKHAYDKSMAKEYSKKKEEEEQKKMKRATRVDKVEETDESIALRFCARGLHALLLKIIEERDTLQTTDYQKTIIWSDLITLICNWLYPMTERSQAVTSVAEDFAQKIQAYITEGSTEANGQSTLSHDMKEIKDYIISMTQDHISTLSGEAQANWFRVASGSEISKETILDRIKHWTKTRIRNCTRQISLGNYVSITELNERYLKSDYENMIFYKNTVSGSGLYDAIAEETDMAAEDLENLVKNKIPQAENDIEAANEEQYVPQVINSQLWIFQFNKDHGDDFPLKLRQKYEPSEGVKAKPPVYLMYRVLESGRTKYYSLTRLTEVPADSAANDTERPEDNRVELSRQEKEQAIKTKVERYLKEEKFHPHFQRLLNNYFENYLHDLEEDDFNKLYSYFGNYSKKDRTQMVEMQIKTIEEKLVHVTRDFVRQQLRKKLEWLKKSPENTLELVSGISNSRALKVNNEVRWPNDALLPLDPHWISEILEDVVPAKFLDLSEEIEAWENDLFRICLKDSTSDNLNNYTNKKIVEYLEYVSEYYHFVVKITKKYFKNSEIYIKLEPLYMVINNILRNHRDNLIQFKYENRSYNDMDRIEGFIYDEYRLVLAIVELGKLHRRIRNSNNRALKEEFKENIRHLITFQVRQVTRSENDNIIKGITDRLLEHLISLPWDEDIRIQLKLVLDRAFQDDRDALIKEFKTKVLLGDIIFAGVEKYYQEKVHDLNYVGKIAGWILEDIKREGNEYEKRILGYFENPEEETKRDEYIEKAIEEEREEIIFAGVEKYYQEKVYDLNYREKITGRILGDIEGEGDEYEKRIRGYFENPEEETKRDEYIEKAIAAFEQEKRKEINEDLRTRIRPQVVSYFDEKGYNNDNDLVDDITYLFIEQIATSKDSSEEKEKWLKLVWSDDNQPDRNSIIQYFKDLYDTRDWETLERNDRSVGMKFTHQQRIEIADLIYAKLLKYYLEKKIDMTDIIKIKELMIQDIESKGKEHARFIGGFFMNPEKQPELYEYIEEMIAKLEIENTVKRNLKAQREARGKSTKERFKDQVSIAMSVFFNSQGSDVVSNETLRDRIMNMILEDYSEEIRILIFDDQRKVQVQMYIEQVYLLLLDIDNLQVFQEDKDKENWKNTFNLVLYKRVESYFDEKKYNKGMIPSIVKMIWEHIFKLKSENQSENQSLYFYLFVGTRSKTRRDNELEKLKVEREEYLKNNPEEITELEANPENYESFLLTNIYQDEFPETEEEMYARRDAENSTEDADYFANYESMIPFLCDKPRLDKIGNPYWVDMGNIERFKDRCRRFEAAYLGIEVTEIKEKFENDLLTLTTQEKLSRKDAYQAFQLAFKSIVNKSLTNLKEYMLDVVGMMESTDFHQVQSQWPEMISGSWNRWHWCVKTFRSMVRSVMPNDPTNSEDFFSQLSTDDGRKRGRADERMNFFYVVGTNIYPDQSKKESNHQIRYVETRPEGHDIDEQKGRRSKYFVPYNNLNPANLLNCEIYLDGFNVSNSWRNDILKQFARMKNAWMRTFVQTLKERADIGGKSQKVMDESLFQFKIDPAVVQQFVDDMKLTEVDKEMERKTAKENKQPPRRYFQLPEGCLRITSDYFDDDNLKEQFLGFLQKFHQLYFEKRTSESWGEGESMARARQLFTARYRAAFFEAVYIYTRIEDKDIDINKFEEDHKDLYQRWQTENKTVDQIKSDINDTVKQERANKAWATLPNQNNPHILIYGAQIANPYLVSEAGNPFMVCE